MAPLQGELSKQRKAERVFEQVEARIAAGKEFDDANSARDDESLLRVFGSQSGRFRLRTN